MGNMDQLRQRLESAGDAHRKGDIPAAFAAYRAVLNDWPGQPDALHMLGVIAMQTGSMPLAAQLFDETVKVVPQFSLGWANRAVAYRAMGRNDEAMNSVQRALEADPRNAGAWNMLGILLRDERRYDEALRHHARAAELEPNNANIRQNHAAILLSCSRIPEAWQEVRAAERLNPNRADTLTTAGNILVAAGYPDRAIPYYHKAQAADPRYVDAVNAEATTCLYMGDFARGWELMEKRRLYLHDERCTALPRWQGQKVEHLLVVAEQGAGDSIQFVRYLPLLKDRVKRVTLQVPANLQRLMQFNFPDVDVILPGNPLPPADAFEPLMSLAYHCGGSTAPIPSSYLRADEGWRAPWRERLKNIPRPHIGFVWAGNPQQINDYNRSIPFERMAPLIKRIRPHAIAIQKDAVSYDAALFASDVAPHLNDYADAAGLMDILDLLVTVDTSPAHLAGALDKPVWTLLPFDPGWRYMIGRDDSAFYSSMRVFRQPAPCDWASALEKAAGELQKFMAGDQAVLAPARWTGPFLRENPLALRLPD